MNERAATRPATLLGRLGIDGPASSPRIAWGLLAALLGVYAAAFLVYYPEIALGTDEASYIRQAKLFLDGRTSQFSIGVGEEHGLIVAEAYGERLGK